MTPGPQQTLSAHESLARDFERWQKEYFDEVDAHFVRQDKARGAVAFAAWEHRFLGFLDRAVPSLVPIYQKTVKMHPATNHPRLTVHQNWKWNKGDAVEAFLAQAIQDARAGRIDIVAQQPQKPRLGCGGIAARIIHWHSSQPSGIKTAVVTGVVTGVFAAIVAVITLVGTISEAVLPIALAPKISTPTQSTTVPPTSSSTPSSAPTGTSSATPTPTATPVPANTETSTHTPSVATAESTFTLTPASGLIPSYAIHDCIDAAVWNFWNAPFSSPRDQLNHDCLDLSKWGIAAQNHNSLDERLGLRINFEADGYIPRGIYFHVPPKKEMVISLSIVIDELEAYEECETDKTCDANLAIGVRDQDTNAGKGWYLVFRVRKKGGDRLICFLDDPHYTCYTSLLSESPPYQSPTTYEVRFTIRPLDAEVKIQGATIDYGAIVEKGAEYDSASIIGGGADSITIISRHNLPDRQQRIFWIGYSFRRPGAVKAFITFPTPVK